MILVVSELYLLFFQNHSNSVSQNNTTKPNVKTSQSITRLTKDAQHAENFNQEVKPTSDLAKQIDQKLSDNQFIGTALIIKDGQIILQKGFGYANFGKQLPNTYQSLFQIGSIQKGMTATLILKQIQAGRLSLDETLDHFYPTIPDSQNITIRQLLSMTSGLCQKVKATNMMSDDAFLRFAFSNVTMGDYGKFKYDAINYFLLVGILEKLTDASYQQLFHQMFNQHLQLSHTMFYNNFLTSNNRTYAYARTNGKDFSSEIKDKPLLFNQEVGTGNIAMTTGDLYLFYYNLLEGKIVDHQTMNTLWTPETQKGYMGGVYNFSNYVQGHGVEEGFETNAFISKDTKNSVILFTNEYPGAKIYQELSKNIFDLLGSY
ncbi:hypothetical protein RV12_GL001407 [Enterococcus quebecensis]|nr:hypothetical protein RV12_GL001407 [Enterococcus quebecensis]